MHRRFDAGPLLAALGAAALGISLFLSWFEPDLNAWELFEALDLLLAALAVAIVFLALRPAPEGRLLAALAAAALVVVVVQLVEPPPLAAEADRELGAWLALAGSALALLGAVLVLAAISVQVDVRGREHRRREAAVDRRARAAGAESRPPAGPPGPPLPGATVPGGAAADPGTGTPAAGARPGTHEGSAAAGAAGAAEPTEEPGSRSLFARRDPDATQTFAPLDDDDHPPVR